MSDLGYDYTGCRILVTGGTRGLGLTVAQAFAQFGADVAVTGTQFLPSAYSAPVQSFAYHRLELTDTESIDRVARQLGPIDVLVNAAGARVPSSYTVHEREFVHSAVQLGLLGPTQVMRKLRRPLSMSQMVGGGVVIDTSQTNKWMAITDGTGSYRDLVELAGPLVRSWSHSGVRINQVNTPAPAPTPGLSPSDAWSRSETEPNGAVLTRGRTDQIAAVVVFLASRGATGLSGQRLTVGPN